MTITDNDLAAAREIKQLQPFHVELNNPRIRALWERAEHLADKVLADVEYGWFIVQPTAIGEADGDTLFELCRYKKLAAAVRRRDAEDCYDLDEYEQMETAGSLREIEKLATEKHGLDLKEVAYL